MSEQLHLEQDKQSDIPGWWRRTDGFSLRFCALLGVDAGAYQLRLWSKDHPDARPIELFDHLSTIPPTIAASALATGAAYSSVLACRRLRRNTVPIRRATACAIATAGLGTSLFVGWAGETTVGDRVVTEISELPAVPDTIAPPAETVHDWQDALWGGVAGLGTAVILAQGIRRQSPSEGSP